MTFRAVKVLKEVDIILAEDTRNSSPMLKHFGIDKKLFSHHQHNEHKAVNEIIRFLKEGQNIALISDAGTPAISDPGYLLTREAIKNDLEVECLPGATAFVPALVNSGLPNDRFVFEGFLPVKKGRQTRLKELASEERTMIFYESPHRLLKSLEEFITFFGEEREVSVSRELTKMYEETKRGTLTEVKNYFETNTLKGEFVICLAGKPAGKPIKEKFRD
jgi:16S rRNA (cytidine1402-2'-O)-methyltransferase